MRVALKISVAIGLLLMLLFLSLSVARDWSAPEDTRAPRAIPLVTAAAPAPDAAFERRLTRFCGDCHPVPNPANFPRDRWQYGVLKGYEYYARSGRMDLDPPPLNETLRYYLRQAPEQPSFPRSPEASHPLKTRFEVEKRYVGPASLLPEISTLQWMPFQEDGASRLVACDARYGQVVALDATDANTPPSILARLDHPARLQPCELSGDGATEFLVADLGSYLPADHQRGRIVLLRREAGGAAFEKIVLASGLGRVADVRAADFDGDDKQDFIVAEFGWIESGGILFFRNVTEAGQELEFAPRKIDVRPGTIHVPIHDFDRDGRPDFAAIISQETESVDVFLNAPPAAQFTVPRDLPFHHYTVWEGPDLTFGSSGLTLHDLDQDGDMDMLMTSGDSWDNKYAAPTHGVHWLENRGSLDFRYHRLAHMPGAFAARAGDVDGDGDEDIVAVAWMASPTNSASLEAQRPLASIVCLEQTEPGEFVHHTLERESLYYSAVELADFDLDGDLDFALGSGPMVAENRNDKYYLAIWWNQAQSAGAAAE